VVVKAAGVLIASPRSTRTRAESRRYYLSLGDSLSTGVQPIGVPELQFRTLDGYADQLGSIARTAIPGISTVKLGFPGESTTTMIEGGLRAYDHGSQLDEAVAFLREHRDETAFVTIDIGSNDFLTHDLEALPVGLESLGANLPSILGRLRDAAGPSVPMAGMTMYDPFLAHWLLGPEGREMAERSVWDALVPINAVFEAMYRAAGLTCADVEGAFATTDFHTLVDVPGTGLVPLNVARVCDWTWAGAPPPLGPDSHANREGYRVIAEAFARVVLPQVGACANVQE
jgi:lysophospholipase L1-like esterase